MAFLCFYTYYICAKLRQYHGLKGRRITDVTTQITETVRFLSCKAYGQIFIHRFPLSRIRNMIPRKHNSAHMATHTPFRPMVGASHAANEIRTAQILKKFINDGTRVLAAPTNTPYDMMAAANIGSAKASMRSAITPNLRISSTGVIVPIICGAKMYITTPIIPMTAMPMNTVM